MFIQVVILYTQIYPMLGKDRTKKSLSTIATKELMTVYTNNALTGQGKLLDLFLFNNSREMRLTCMHPESWQVCNYIYICSYICMTIFFTFVLTFVFTSVCFHNMFTFVFIFVNIFGRYVITFTFVLRFV